MVRKVWVGSVASILALFLLLPVTAFGQEFTAILRDENALALTPTVRSQGMGGTYVGIDEYWSNNPACIVPIDKVIADFAYGNWKASDGPDTDAYRIDAWLPIKIASLDVTLRLMGYYYESDKSPTTAAGFESLEFDSTTIGLQAGINIFDWWAVGLGAYPYEKGKANLILPDDDGDIAVDAEAMSQVGSIQLGTLFRLPLGVSVGGQGIYIRDELKASYNPPGVPFRTKDDFDIWYLTAGVGWEPCEFILIGVDYWYGNAKGDSFMPGETFDKDVDRWNFGAEVRPLDWISIRAGSDNGGFTAGGTVSVMGIVDLNYAYVDKAFRDKEDVWGKTEMHTASATIKF